MIEAFLAALGATLFDPRAWAGAGVTLVVGIMRGFAGFGTAIALAPFYSLLWSPREGVPVVLLMEALIGFQLVPQAWPQTNRRVVLPLALAAIVMIPFGSFVLVAADPELLRRSMGAFVAGFTLVLAIGWRYHGRRPLPVNIAVGLVAGLMKGATGMAGPPVILYLLAGAEEARIHRANLILFFAMVGLAAVLPLLWYELVTAPVAARLALMLPFLFVGVRIGVGLFGKVGQKTFRAAALSFLGVVGVAAAVA